MPHLDNPPRSEYHLTGKGRDLWPVVSHSMDTRSPSEQGQAPAKATFHRTRLADISRSEDRTGSSNGTNGPASRPQAST